MTDENSFRLDVPEGTRAYIPTMHVIEGREDRFERYKLYEKLDKSADIYTALTLIATEKEGAIRGQLGRWQVPMKPHNVSVFDITRKVLKYGDWFMFKSPETEDFVHISPKCVLGALVDNAKKNTTVEAWIIKDFKIDIPNDGTPSHDGLKTLQSMSKNTTVVPHSYIRHLSMMTTGPVQRIDSRSLWPFGISWLDEAIVTKSAVA